MLIPFLSSFLRASLLISTASQSDAADFASESKGMQMLVVTCTGLIVVFLVLIILIMVFNLFGVVNSGKKKSLPSGAGKKSLDSGEPRLAVAQGESPAALPPSGISEEVIAAISAAVAVTLEGKPFAIRRVQRAPSGRNAWANAGVLESTRPF